MVESELGAGFRPLPATLMGTGEGLHGYDDVA